MTQRSDGSVDVGNVVRQDDLSASDGELVLAAESAAGHASPVFSRFFVGAALRTDKGSRIYPGWNVEDRSLSKVVHAEHMAMVAAIHSERGPVRVQELAVWGRGDVPPCGACRQMLFESNPNARILFPYKGGVLVATASALLPFGFLIDPARPES
jgi:cytidine deaminase